MPEVSVLLCNYNYGRFLQKGLSGLLRQSFTDLEVVITDDGSTDGSQEIIAGFAAADPRVKPVYFPANRGVVAAVQDALSRVRGRLLFCQGADDFVISEHFFSLAVAALRQHPTAAGFYGIAGLYSHEREKLVGGIGSAPVTGLVTPEQAYPAFLRGQLFVPGSSCLWRVDLLQAAGGFDYSLGPQLDFQVNHLLAARHGVVFQPTPVTCQRVYDQQTNFGSRATLWEAAARYARIEEHLRAALPPYPEMENDWKLWRARWMADAIAKTGVRLDR